MRRKIVYFFLLQSQYCNNYFWISTSSARNTHGIVRSAPNTKARIFVFIAIVCFWLNNKIHRHLSKGGAKLRLLLGLSKFFR
jgi:nicotinamide riboside transporter PnuC